MAEVGTTTDDRRPMDNLRKRVATAHAEIDRLVNGGRWKMAIPARPDVDSDLVISAALADTEWLIAERDSLAAELVSLRGQLEAATEAVAATKRHTDSGEAYHVWFTIAAALGVSE